MTPIPKSLAAAAAMMPLVIATTALGQSGGQRPCGDYYGSEYGLACTQGSFGSIGRNTCAYRTGPPCAPAGVPPRRRR